MFNQQSLNTTEIFIFPRTVIYAPSSKSLPEFKYLENQNSEILNEHEMRAQGTAWSWGFSGKAQLHQSLLFSSQVSFILYQAWQKSKKPNLFFQVPIPIIPFSMLYHYIFILYLTTYNSVIYRLWWFLIITFLICLITITCRV